MQLKQTSLDRTIIDIKSSSNDYQVIITENYLDCLEEFLNRKYPELIKLYIITDKQVGNLYLKEFIKRLEKYTPKILEITPGEAEKNFSVVGDVCNRLLELNIDRQSLIIALGGGVVGDIAGFASSIILRGVDYINIPTSLLAQVDSSIGGKTGVNTTHGKNLIGSFYEPKLVIIDPSFLTSLNDREYISGLAEIYKHALIQDAVFFNFLNINSQKIRERDTQLLIDIITKSCKIKRDIVEQDQYEKNIRKILNFGHSFAHALEAQVGYNNIIKHGEAVAIGINMAYEYASSLGLCSTESVEEVKNSFKKIGLVTTIRDIEFQWHLEKIMDYLMYDKKRVGEKTTFILPVQIGEVMICDNIELSSVKAFISQELQ